MGMFTFAFIKSRLHYIRVLLPRLSLFKIYIAFIAWMSFLLKRDRSCTCPPLLSIVLTLRCNYACIMCQKSSVNDNPYKNPETIDYDILASFLRENARYLSLIRLHGGEPLFYNRISDLIDLLNELKIPFSVISNGYLLTPELSEKLVKNCIGLSLSIDAVDPEIYAKMRRGGDIKKLTANIQYLNKLKKEQRTKTPTLNVSMTSFSFNMSELPKLVRYCHDNGIESLSAGEGWFYDTPEIREEHLIKNHPDLVGTYTAEAKKIAKELGIILRLRFPGVTKRNKVPQKQAKLTQKLRSCFNLYVSSFIHPNLDVQVCCDGRETFGNMKDTNFREIWNGPKYIDARRKLRNNEVPAACAGCANMLRI